MQLGLAGLLGPFDGNEGAEPSSIGATKIRGSSLRPDGRKERHGGSAPGHAQEEMPVRHEKLLQQQRCSNIER